MSSTFRVGDVWESPMQHRFEVSSVEDGIATLEPRSAGAYWHRWPADRVGRWKLLERADQSTPAAITPRHPVVTIWRLPPKNSLGKLRRSNA